MLIYADGSALSRWLGTDAESASWSGWADENAERLVTSPLGITELRRAVPPADTAARDKVRDLIDRLEVVRFFDQSLKSAAMASSVLSPFGAIHLGIAVAHPDVEQMATYDAVLARVAVIHGLDVVTPGRADDWWQD